MKWGESLSTLQTQFGEEGQGGRICGIDGEIENRVEKSNHEVLLKHFFMSTCFSWFLPVGRNIGVSLQFQ